MKNLITIDSYNRNSFSYAAQRNTTVVTIQGVGSAYFSFDTLVAVSGGTKTVVAKNVWSSTTGKHLNWIDPNKDTRVDIDTLHTFATYLFGEVPSIQSYIEGAPATEAKCMQFSIGHGFDVYFSYETVIGLYADGKLETIRNYWQGTTGKHLNLIDNYNHKNRLEAQEFDTLVNKQITTLADNIKVRECFEF